MRLTRLYIPLKEKKKVHLLLKNDVNNRELSLLKISYDNTQLRFYESLTEFRGSLAFLEGGVELNVWRVFNYDFPTT